MPNRAANAKTSVSYLNERQNATAGGKSHHLTLDNPAHISYIPKPVALPGADRKQREEKPIADGAKNIPAHLLEDEAEIIRRCKEGDREAFNALVRKHEKKVYNLCCRILGNQHEAEDVAQDVFVTVFRAIKSFRGDSAFSTWLHRVAVNNCKNRIKYLSRRRYFRTESMEQTLDTGEGEMVREFGDEDGISPEDALETSELGGAIQAAINELENEYRIVIVLRDVQGFSYKEISESLDLKEGTVKSRIHRARMELKTKLEHLI